MLAKRQLRKNFFTGHTRNTPSTFYTHRFPFKLSTMVVILFTYSYLGTELTHAVRQKIDRLYVLIGRNVLQLTVKT